MITDFYQWLITLPLDVRILVLVCAIVCVLAGVVAYLRTPGESTRTRVIVALLIAFLASLITSAVISIALLALAII